ncbi:hypothetical protein QYE76_050155 [Lolium multiflorum]|uniref:Transposase-associated domain-containing protein n=1 Tax=Lolium multiflorum TaxID=4521 RepID=A0AAD8SPF2_LOLMU|nr:hypothetical protein QYE76_050155 [Lolium multiflorum]
MPPDEGRGPAAAAARALPENALGGEKEAIMVIEMSGSIVMRYLKHAIIDMYENNRTEVLCPCRRCKRGKWFDPYSGKLQGHLLTNGFMHGHTQWMSDDGAEVNGATAAGGRGLGESRLRVALDVLQMKAKDGWTDTSVDDILEYVKDLLPARNTCPGSLAEAKRITCPLDLPHEKYHACINDCIMYRKEHMDKTKCPVCEAERYKKGKKKAPRKVVWYFPLAPGFNGSTRTARKQSSCAGTQKERRQC